MQYNYSSQVIQLESLNSGICRVTSSLVVSITREPRNTARHMGAPYEENAPVHASQRYYQSPRHLRLSQSQYV